VQIDLSESSHATWQSPDEIRSSKIALKSALDACSPLTVDCRSSLYNSDVHLRKEEI